MCSTHNETETTWYHFLFSRKFKMNAIHKKCQSLEEQIFSYHIIILKHNNFQSKDTQNDAKLNKYQRAGSPSNNAVAGAKKPE